MADVSERRAQYYKIILFRTDMTKSGDNTAKSGNNPVYIGFRI